MLINEQFIMIRKAINILKNQKGQAFLENALYIIGSVFVLAGAAFALAKLGVKPKFTDLQTQITNVDVPDIQ